MLKKVKTSSETYQHFCNNKRKGYKPPIDIFLHDIKAYIIDETGDIPNLIDIRYCPFCGIDVESENS